MPSSYSLSKTLPSCNVDKILLEELEQYIQQKVQNLADPDNKDEVSYELHIKDSIGLEQFNSINEYNKTYFPNDTEGITIGCRSLYTKNNHQVIKIRFATRKFASEINVSLVGNSAREIALSLSDEILRIIEPYKTKNYLFNPNGIHGLAVFAVTCLCASFLSGNELLSEPYKKFAQAVVFVAMICGFSWFILLFFKPYCTFKTALNEKRETKVKWIVTGIIGFILFTVVGVYFRQMLLGF